MRIQNSDMSWPDKFSFVTHDLETSGLYEQTLEDLRPRIKSTDIVLDMGAHIGYYTCMFAQLAAQVIAFEPDPENFSYLKKNVDQNGYKNVTLHNVACSDKVGVMQLYHAIKCTGMHRVYPSVYCEEKSITVKGITIDSVVPFANVVKIDVEGHEWWALHGMQRILKQVRLMYMEHTRACLDEVGISSKKMLQFLKEIGFQVRVRSYNNLVCTKNV